MWLEKGGPITRLAAQMKQVAEDAVRTAPAADVVAESDAVDQGSASAPAGTLSEHVRNRLRDIEQRHATALAGLAQREVEVTALRQRIDHVRAEDDNALRRMQQALQDARRSHSRSERTATALRRDLDEAQAELRAAQSRSQDLERHVATLSAVLDATRADVERAAASRAWRYGHRLARIASRMMLRKHRTDGALRAALERLDQVQRLDQVRHLRPASPAGASPRTGVTGSGHD